MIIKDCIYGHINVPDLCIPFLDVSEFQRLRRVKQLGMAHFGYPSATHTRFEHSLGVMHLTGKIIEILRFFTDIPERIKQLVQLGGLYHDIGHFAYSHLFDTFLSKISFDNIPFIFSLKHHEERSVYFLKQVNSRLKLLSLEEEKFIEDIIVGNIGDSFPPFLYQIVHNSECGVDTDRLDYLNRDSYHTGFPGFQADYIILNSTIDDKGYLAFNKKAKTDISDLFKSRKRMYTNVYLHHTTLKMDKLFFCMMRRLGRKLFTYGEATEDCNIETLFRNSLETQDIIKKIDNRSLDHTCPFCDEYIILNTYTPSGKIHNVRFV